MTRTWQRLVGALSTLALLGLTYVLLAANNDLHDNDSQIGYGIIFHGLMLLLAAVISATAVAQEVEGDTWTVLMASPLSATSIVLGKLLGVLRRLMWPLILFAAHFLAFTIAGVLDFQSLVLTICVMVFYNFFFVATGVYLSLRIPKVTFAVVVNLAIPVLMYIGVPVMLLIVGEMIDDHNLAEQMLWYLPFYWIGQGIDSQGDFTVRLEMMQGDVSYAKMFTYAISIGLAHVVAGALIVWHTILKFDRIVGRAVQSDPLPTSLRRAHPYNVA